MALDQPSTNADVITADLSLVFHSWSAQGHIHPLPIAGGKGCEFWDHDGNRWLDFSSQLINLNLGHQHPRVVAAIVEQAERLCMVAPSAANENAIRMARLHTDRQKVLASYRSYHGATAGAIALTGEPKRWGAEPTIPGVVHFLGPYPYRSSFGATTAEEEGERALAHLAEIVQYEGGDRVAAIILETIVGGNGVLLPPDGYLAGVRSLCDEHGIVMILDEVMVGFGRTGQWFGADHWDVAPDLLTFAKGVNSGYVPLGGVMMTEAIAASFADSPYPGGLTYSGHPLACAAAVGAIRAMEDEGVVENAARIGRDVLGPGLTALAERHPSVGEVRGLGCFYVIELVRDPTSREMFVPFNASGAAAAPMNEVVDACKDLGVWPYAHFNRLHLAPPLVVTDTECARALAVLDEVLDVSDRYLVR